MLIALDRRPGESIAATKAERNPAALRALCQIIHVIEANALALQQLRNSDAVYVLHHVATFLPRE